MEMATSNLSKPLRNEYGIPFVLNIYIWGPHASPLDILTSRARHEEMERRVRMV